MKRFFLSAAVMASLSLVSCSPDDDPGSTTDPVEVEVPENYTFTRDNASTVSFSGQTTRIGMVGEITSAFTDFENTTQESLSNMFSNTNNPFENADFNASEKSVKSKVAASQDYFAMNAVESNEIKNDFESYISQQVEEVFANQNEVAAPGIAGQILDGESIRYVNGKGVELNQVFAKGLIGGLLLDQILNNYLSTAVLDEGQNIEMNNNAVTEENENYTTMEHKWDEAYGYLYGHPSIPFQDPNSALNNSGDRLLFNYLGRVDSDADFAGIAEDVFQAFLTGRAAIVAGEYDLRDEQIEIIKEKLSKVIAVRAVHYLQGGKTAIQSENMGAAFHELSEGFGFLYSLRFTNNPETGEPYIAPNQLETWKNELLAGNGFWDVSPETLDEISESIADAFGFSVAAAQ